MEFALTRRTAQPQGVAEINWDNPIMRGLVFLHSAADLGVNQVNGKHWDFQDGTIAQSSSGNGAALDLSAFRADWNLDAPLAYPLSMFTQRRGWTGADNPLLGAFGDGYTGRNGIVLGNENGNLASTVLDGGFTGISATGSAPQDFEQTISVTASAASFLTLYQDGRVVNSGTTSTARSDLTRVAFNLIDSFDRFGCTGNAVHSINAIWDRELEAWEEQSLADNPNQFWKPLANVLMADPGIPADLTAPEFPVGATLGFIRKTNSTVLLKASAPATDNVGVVGYEWSSDGGASYPFTSLGDEFEMTALADLTSYNFRVRAYDGAGNRSAHLALTTSTYRAGDTAANIIANTAAVGGNPAGHMYALALTLPAGTWMSYRTISGPTPSGGTLTQYVDGRFTYFGLAAAVWTTQAELDMVDHTEQTIVNLYDQTNIASPRNLSGGATVTRPASTQTHQATPRNASASGTLTRSSGIQDAPVTEFSATPRNLSGGATVTRSLSSSLSAGTSLYVAEVTDQSPAILATYVKQPAETQDYDLDFSAYLDPMEDAIATHLVTVPTGLTLLSSLVVGKVVKVWVSGGANRAKLKLTVRINTTGGRIKEAEIYVRIKEV